MDEFSRWRSDRSRNQALNDRIAELEAEIASFKKKNPFGSSILDHGYIILYDWMGDDLRIVNMARQSFGQESTEIGDKEKGLINFLMRERHGTPFEGPVFTFNVKCPIFVAREWMRHRIGSFNEYSGRYSKMISEFYIPAKDQIRTQKGKPGAYHFEPIDVLTAEIQRTRLIQTADITWKNYEEALKSGVAKEVARMHLPVNIYTQFTWVVNLRALLNFISLRSHESAMWEIRQYSKEIELLIKEVCPVAFEAFKTNGRVAP